MGTLLLLAGAKGVGKSWVADIAENECDVYHLDADSLILDLIESGRQPHPDSGWLEPVERAVLHALGGHERVSVEITGAWDSDYTLARDVEQHGHRVLRVWISAPIEQTLARLVTRTTRKAPVTEAEARAIYQQAQARAARESWDAVLDTSGAERPEAVAAVIRALVDPN